MDTSEETQAGAKQTPDQKLLEEATRLKDKGNDLVKEKKLEEALAAYTAAINLIPTNELFWSNRSMVYYQLGDGINALSDADRCLQLNPNWSRGYSRKVNALHLLGRHEDIMDTCKERLAVEQSDAMVKNLNFACLARLEGKFWGTTSEAQGAYEQELEFSKDRLLKVRFFGQEIVCTYHIDATKTPMTMVITMPQQPPMTHIFRFTAEGIDLCSPSATGTNPTAFEGDGFIALKRGPQPQEPEDLTVRSLSWHDKLALYIEETIKIVPKRIEGGGPDAFLTIIQFQKNFYRLRVRFGPEVAESITRLLQGGMVDDVPENIMRRVYVLREKMRDAGLFEDPSGAEGEDTDYSSPATATHSTTTNSATTSAAQEPTTASRPTETKQPTSSNQPARTRPVSSDGSGGVGISLPVKVIVSLVVAGGLLAAAVVFFNKSKTEGEPKTKRL